MINKKETYDAMEFRTKQDWWMGVAIGLLETIEEHDEDEKIKLTMEEKKAQVKFVLGLTQQALQDRYDDYTDEICFPSLWDTLGLDDNWIYSDMNDDFFCTEEIEKLPIWIDTLHTVINFLFARTGEIRQESWDSGKFYA